MPRLPEGFQAALEAAFRNADLPPPKLIDLDPLAGGSVNRSFLMRMASGVAFCKWNDSAPADMFRQEAAGLAALKAAGTSLIVPRTMALWPDSGSAEPAGPGLLVLEYLEPDADEPSAETWEELGRGLAALHRAPEDRFGWAHDNYCGLTLQDNEWTGDWPGFFAAKRIGAVVERLGRKDALTPAELKTYAALLEKLPTLLAHAPRPSLIHGDLWSGNFLASNLGPALVDPAIYCADREAELAMMALFGGFPDRVLDAYQESWPLPPEWRERMPIYQLYHVLNHQLLFGGSYGGQAIRIARKFV